MKLPIKLFAAFGAFLFLFIVLTAFIFADPKPDFYRDDLQAFEGVSTNQITTSNKEVGWLKSQVTFCGQGHLTEDREFYGQEIQFTENEKLDKVRIGVTNNLISRIELWNNGRLIRAEELGFVGKMTWGAEQELHVHLFDQDQSKHPGKARISMHFSEVSSFFGDIGTISMDLSDYGDLTGSKSISMFLVDLDENETLDKSYFSNLSVWKDYAPID